MLPDDKHGTNTGYSFGCRCEHSKRAHRDQMRSYRNRLYLQRGPATVDATGTIRRIQALRRLGWSRQALADALGWANRQSVTEVCANRRVYRTTHRAVAALYARLSMRIGPSSRAAAHAERMGWAPPLAWDNIDDPAEQPVGTKRTVHRTGRRRTDIDPVVVDQLLDGERVPSTPAEKREAMRRWIADGKSERSLCVIHGWNESRYVDRGAA